MFKPVVSCALSPNTEVDDVITALLTLFVPWKWKRGEAIDRVEQWFRQNLRTNTVISLNSGRSALLALLASFGIGKGDEVLLQAFTCVAVPNSILWAGATPVYVDIDETLNIDPVECAKKVSRKTKAIIVQHTFGAPAQMDALLAFAQKHHLILIEDCAHSLGATYNGKKVGTLGDAAFFSFGRDKVLSSVWGGMAIINAKCQMPNAKLKNYQERLPYPSFFWIFQQLLHPIAFSIILLLYDVIAGKLLLFILQKLRLLSYPVYTEEKRGRKPTDFPAKFPNALAMLLVHQLDKLGRYNTNRKKIASYYRHVLQLKHDGKVFPDVEGSIYLRFPIATSKVADIYSRAKRAGVILGNWYSHVIDPKGVVFEAIGYRIGSCPKAEAVASRILNLPTRVTYKQALRVMQSF